MDVLKEVKCDEIIYVIHYSLLEFVEQSLGTAKTYGFRLEQYKKGNRQDELIDWVETGRVFEEYALAESFFLLMIEESVFPNTLYYHIDDCFCAFCDE